MITLPALFEKKISVDNDKAFDCRIVLENVWINSEYLSVEISHFISSFGNIHREIEYDIGLFRPVSHSFSLDENTEMNGIKTFTKRFGDNVGTRSWINSKYSLYIGFRKENVWVHIYEGIIESRLHDRDNQTISVSSQDISKNMLDVKVCTTLSKDTVFRAPLGTYPDTVQQVIRYGTHTFPRFLGKSHTGANSDQSYYGSCVKGYYNSLYQYLVGVTNHPAGYAWYFPIQNYAYKSADFDEYEDGTLRVWVYYTVTSSWMYIKYSIISDLGNVRFYQDPTLPGLYLLINPSCTNITLIDGLNESSETVIARETFVTMLISSTIVIEVMEHIQVHGADAEINPATVIYDLLTNKNVINIPDISNILDELEMNISYDTNYSFDTLYQYYHSTFSGWTDSTEIEESKFNLQVNSETTLQSILNEICRYCGIFLFMSSKKEATPESTTYDRRLKVVKLRNYVYATDLLATRSYSTNCEVTKLSINEDGLNLFRDFNCEYLYVTEGSSRTFDFAQATAIGSAVNNGKTFSLGGSNFNNICWWFNLSAAAQDTIDVYKERYDEPVETVTIEIDIRTLYHEPADYIGVYDKLHGEFLVFQIYVISFSTDEGKVTLSGPLLYSTFDMTSGTLADRVWTEIGSAASASETKTEIGSGGTQYEEVGSG